MTKFSLFFGCFAGLFSADVPCCLPDCTFSARVDASVVVLKSNSTIYNLRPPAQLSRKFFRKFQKIFVDAYDCSRACLLIAMSDEKRIILLL
jgi:hypothetical protein